MRSSYPEEITDKTQILAIQILIGGLVLSAVFYAVIVLVFMMPGVVQNVSEADSSSALNYTYLTFFTIVLTVVVIPLSYKLFNSNLSKISESGEAIVQIRTAYVLKFAAIEGVALLGLTIMILAATDLQIDENPLIWLNALPFLWLLLTSITQFPTAERIKQLYTEYSAV